MSEHPETPGYVPGATVTTGAILTAVTIATPAETGLREALEGLRALSDEATPGPWKWGGQVGQYVDLVTVGRGVLTVMGSKRLGMNGAEPVFWRRPADAPWGWNGKREPASEVAVREVPYRDDIVDIDNPNARLIVAAVNFLRTALSKEEK